MGRSSEVLTSPPPGKYFSSTSAASVNLQNLGNFKGRDRCSSDNSRFLSAICTFVQSRLN
jgi:hypothetical protein